MIFFTRSLLSDDEREIFYSYIFFHLFSLTTIETRVARAAYTRNQVRFIYFIRYGNFANEMKTNFTSICWYVCHMRHTGRKLFMKIDRSTRLKQSSDSCNSQSDWRLHTYYLRKRFVCFEHSFGIGLRLIIQEELMLLEICV